MTAIFVPPTSRLRAFTTLRSRFSSEEARLYGAMIGRTFSTPSPGSRTSVRPGRSSPMAAITVWCVPWITCGLSPSAVMCAATCSICAAVASVFMTTITLERPPESRTESSSASRGETQGRTTIGDPENETSPGTLP